MKINKKELLRTAKYILVAISAGVIQIVSSLLLELVIFKHIIPENETLNIGIKVVDKSSFIAESIGLALSIVWNFTFNRKYTFKAATNVPLSMALAFLFYVPFYPFQVWYIDAVRNALISGIGENFAFVVAQATCMIINFVLEFLWHRFVVFGEKVDSATTTTTSAAAGENSSETTEANTGDMPATDSNTEK